MRRGLFRCRTMPSQSCTMSMKMKSLRLRSLALPSPAPAPLAELAQKRPRRWAAVLSVLPRRSCFVWVRVLVRLARNPRSRRMAQDSTHPACASQGAQAVAPEARQIPAATWFSACCLEGRCSGSTTLWQASKAVETAASDFLQAAPPSVATLVEEVAAGARRIAQTRIPAAAAGIVGVGAQSAWAAAETVGARKT